jgi:hypothetical protein
MQIYAPELAAVVPKVLSLLFHHNPAAFAIIATTVRNGATFQVFVDELRRCDLTREDLLAEGAVATSSIVYSRDNVVLHKISRQKTVRTQTQEEQPNVK